MVIYELPTRWVKPGQGQVSSSQQVGVGTFRDVLALISPDDDSPQFSATTALRAREHLIELGVNALELLPPADSPQSLEWGYGTVLPDDLLAPYSDLVCREEGIGFMKKLLGEVAW